MRLKAYGAQPEDLVLELKLPGSVPVIDREWVELRAFLQQVVNRRGLGGLRYGRISRRQRYMTRLAKELRAYRKSGNIEQLLNIAAYAFLESYAPENPRSHFDPNADSVTRGEMGGAV